MSLSAPSPNPLAELLTRCTVRIINGKIQGSGFFVAPGLILTCAHVVESAWQAQTTIDVQKRDYQHYVEARILQFRAIAYPDLALLQIQQTDHPCVLLDQEISLNDQLYAYGYPETHPDGDPVTLQYEGLTGTQHPQLKLKEGQASPGMSGSPLLNLRTGKVCGILRTTRDESSALGGRAIPVQAILQEFPTLVTLHEQFHLLDTQWSRLLPSLTRYNLTNQMVRQALGPSVQLVQFSTISSASESRSQRYYEGALLSWDILAASADVRRDIHDELLHTAINATDQIQMICLHGGPGAGKSTLAWRLSIEVSQTLERPLLHLRNNEESDIWYKLEDFLTQYAIPSVILVDDIFRDYQTCQALTSLSMAVPITIIATARSNEIPAKLRLPFDPYFQEVASPTPTEKAQVLQKLGRDEAMLGTTERKRLQRADSWLIMMLELTTGKDLEKIVQDTVDRLQQQDTIVYRAYEYLCFAGQYDLELPETLLDAMEEQGRFYKVAERSASQGLLTIEHERGTVRTQHALIARQSLQSYRRNPLNIGKELIDAVQRDQDDHHTFLSSLFSRLLSDQQEALVRNLLTQHAEKIDTILSLCSSGALFRWVRIYYLLHEVEKAVELELKVLSRSPRTTTDFIAHLTLVNRLGSKEQIQLVIDETRTWLSTHHQDAVVRHTYLSLVSRHGSKEQVRHAIDETHTWLSTHSQDTNVRQIYLGLVERQDSKEQVKQIIDETRSWLSTYSQDTTIRQTYLGLVERQGSKEQIRGVIDETRAWLATHPQDNAVRQTYLELVERQGSKEQIEKMIDETHTWLSTHPQGTNVRHTYLHLVSRQGNTEQIQLVINETRAWLATYPQDTAVRHTYLNLVGRQDNQDQIQQVINETRAWLATYPQDTAVRHTYLNLVGRQDNQDQIQLVINETQAWLATHLQDTAVRHTYLNLVGRQGDAAQIQRVIDETHAWLSLHPQDTYVRNAYLSLVGRQDDKDQIQLVIDETQEWLSLHPQEITVRHTYLSLVGRQGSPQQIQLVIDETQEWLSTHSQDASVRHTYLGLVKHHGKKEQVQQEIELTRIWLAAHPRNRYMRQRYLELLEYWDSFDQSQEIP